uniref:alpha/beta hydrolase n=1 Tax=Ningiella ruwaisensis TaxID=2364274 RepID=UPI0010A02AF1|nr:alpha/beta hydrolase [Ningiella ruwaisensis]
MLFLTNREPKQSIKSKKGRKFDFDLRINAPSNSVFCCERTGEGKYEELGAFEWFKRIRELKNCSNILFYIHGFSNLPEPDIFPRAEQLQAMFDGKPGDKVLVIPIIWPCDNDIGIVKDYWDDQTSADMSAYSLYRALDFFLKWRHEETQDELCLKRINILAHSMGNRVFRESLAAWEKYSLKSGVPMIFRNVFLVAADIVNESLEPHHRGRFIAQSARNVSVYYASDDLALRASKASNLKNAIASRRLGHSGPEDMRKVPSNVFAIDCDDINTAYDFPSGHSYFLTDKDGKPGAIFEHMFESIDTGRVPLDDIPNRRHRIRDK